MPIRMMVIGDIHIKNKHHERSIALVDDIIRNARTHKPDLVMLLGDVLDGADIIHSNCLLQLTRLLMDISSVCPVYVIMGNHDASTPHVEMPENHALQCFKSLKDRNIHIIDTPTVIQTGCKEKVVIMPYLPPGSFAKHLPLPKEEIGLVFCHQEFEGCVFDGGTKSEHGDPVPTEFKVISGHIHSEQNIGGLWYPGTPTQTRFGESSDKGYFMIEVGCTGDSLSYKITDKITPEVSKFISHQYVIGQSKALMESIDQRNINRAVISATPSQILSLKKSKEYSEIIEVFKGNVKFNVLKESEGSRLVCQQEHTEPRISYIESLSYKARELGLEELLKESLI